MITLILTRHGETTWNRIGKLQGLSNLSVLTAVGKTQADALGAKLADFKIDVIYCSKLKRAKETAAIIAKKIKKDIRFSEKLNERSFGIFEGTEAKSFFAKISALPASRRHLYKPIEGESLVDMERRAYEEVKKIIEQNEGKTVLIVTHGGIIRALVHMLKRIPRQERSDLRIANTSLTIFKLHENKILEELINDIGHLELLAI